MDQVGGAALGCTALPSHNRAAPCASGLQDDPGWNLDRIDQQGQALDHKYQYAATGAQEAGGGLALKQTPLINAWARKL